MPADRTTFSPPPANASPIRIPGSSPGSNRMLHAKLQHGNDRARSTSGSSQTSTSRALAPFPTLLATSDSVLEQNLYDIMWKTFVAFEQDMRDCSQLAPLLPGIEATVSSAVAPISLAADCLADTATYIETDIRDAIEEALATGGTLLSSSPGSSISDGGTRTILSCPVLYSKQFSLASTRVSGSCSTFRATQASLRYYGGARKTAYQLDLFVHKFALPTSTAMHKRGQEFSAANKWLKKMLNGDGRLLDTLELAALRRAGTALKHWAEALRIHSEILRTAASNVRTLLQERVSLQAYSFPSRPPPLEHTQGGMIMSSDVFSPMSQWTTINTLGTPSSVTSGLPELGSSFSPSTAPSSCFSTPENTYSQIMPPESVYDGYSSSPVSQNSLPQSLQQSLPQSAYAQSLPQGGLPQACGFAFATPTYVQDQSIYQQQHHHQMQHLQNQQQQQQCFIPQQLQHHQLQHQQTYPAGLITSPINSPDLSFPTELFFDNLCM